MVRSLVLAALLVGALLLGVLTTALPVSAAEPTLRATPSTGVVDGQEVLVEGSGFEPNTLLEIYECDRDPVDEDDCDGHNAAFVDSDPQGDVAFRFRVDARIYGQQGREIDCRARTQGCVIGVGFLLDADEWPTVALDFDPDAPLQPPVAARVVPDERLVDGQTVTVSASGLAPDRQVWVLQCAPLADPPVCDFEDALQPVPEQDGTLTVPLRLAETLVATNGAVVDCAAASGACVVGVSLGYSFQPDRYDEVPLTFGLRDVTEACPAPGQPPFTDVPATDVHALAVACAARWSITNGRAVTSSGPVYDPAGTVTRGQLASFAVRLLDRSDRPLPPTAPDAFPDDDGGVHEAAADRLAEAGVLLGRGDGTFGPDAPVTRAQATSVLARAAEHVRGSALTGPDAFSDDDGSVHEPAVDGLAAAGVVVGTSPTTFAPGGHLRRDQAASVLMRLTDLLLEEGHAAVPDGAA